MSLSAKESSNEHFDGNPRCAGPKTAVGQLGKVSRLLVHASRILVHGAQRWFTSRSSSVNTLRSSCLVQSDDTFPSQQYRVSPRIRTLAKRLGLPRLGLPDQQEQCVLAMYPHVNPVSSGSRLMLFFPAAQLQSLVEVRQRIDSVMPNFVWTVYRAKCCMKHEACHRVANCVVFRCRGARMSGYTVPEVKNEHYEKYIEEMPSMEGKRVAITGTSSGTGRAIGKAIAMKGGHVLALNRPSERATASSAGIRKDAPEGKVTDIPCDLMSFDSVLAAVSGVETACEGGGLDALVLNAGACFLGGGVYSQEGVNCSELNLACLIVLLGHAPSSTVTCSLVRHRTHISSTGIMAMPDVSTKDEYPQEMQTNHLSQFLLASKLMTCLTQGASRAGTARIVTHSSGARKHPGTNVNPEHYGKNGGSLGGDGNRWERYHQTKLANVCFMQALKVRDSLPC